MELGEKIKKLRIEKGLTQEELAERLYLSRQAVTAWECNRTKPDIESLTLLSKVFDVPLKYFLEDNENIEVEKPRKRPRFIMPLAIGLGIFILVLSISLGIVLPNSSNSDLDADIRSENLVGSYVSLDNVEVCSINELLESSLPYLITIDGKLHTNLMLEEREGYVSYIPANTYRSINYYSIYFDSKTNSYRFVNNFVNHSELGAYFEIGDYKLKYNIVEPNRYMEVISYDSDSNIIRKECFTTTLAGNIINSDGTNIDSIYLDTYYVKGASYYTVRLGMDEFNNKIYNVFNTSELFTNLSCSGIKADKLLMTKFIIN